MGDFGAWARPRRAQAGGLDEAGRARTAAAEAFHAELTGRGAAVGGVVDPDQRASAAVEDVHEESAADNKVIGCVELEQKWFA